MGKPKKRQQVQPGPGGKPAARPASDIQRRALSLVPDSLLSLTTTAPTRPTITIDGIAYRLSFYEDFAVWQSLRLAKLVERVNEFDDLARADEGDEITAAQWEELDRAQLEGYGEMVRVALPDLPEPTLLALNLNQRRAIVDAFFVATGTTVGTPETPQESATTDQDAAATSPTGTPSSPPSAPVTAGRGSTGSARPRRRISAPRTVPSPD